MPGAKMVLLDYILRYPNQKPKIGSAYDEEFIVAKAELISASAKSLRLTSLTSFTQFTESL